jgi:hypothetical protein
VLTDISLFTTEDKKWDIDNLFDSESDLDYIPLLEPKVGKVGRAQKKRIGKAR